MAITWKYDAPAEGEISVAVVFTSDDPEMTHKRGVNAVFDGDGNYDADATETRVGEVAMGVANKIAVGAISPSPEVEETENAVEEAAEAAEAAEAPAEEAPAEEEATEEESSEKDGE